MCASQLYCQQGVSFLELYWIYPFSPIRAIKVGVGREDALDPHLLVQKDGRSPTPSITSRTSGAEPGAFQPPQPEVQGFPPK